MENHTPLQIEQVSQGSTQYNRRININPSTIREVKEAIEKLKNNKLSGEDNIVSELLKHGGPSRRNHLSLNRLLTISMNFH